MTRLLAPLAVFALLLGCETTTRTPLDPDRILHMAGEEAGLITGPRERLARQLNIANRETETGKPAEARKTLAKARETLEQSPKDAFTEQQRLAGWISLSELARNADDKPFANAALDRALAALNELAPQQARCEYVLGIEREVRILRGEPEAAKLLVTAGDWAMELPDQPVRRGAYYAFAHELFRCNDYDGARTVLRKDQDAAWRSDALTVLADRARSDRDERLRTSFGGLSYSVVKSEAPPAADTAAPSSASGFDVRSAPTSFGKPLDFKTNYFRP